MAHTLSLPRRVAPSPPPPPPQPSQPALLVTDAMLSARAYAVELLRNAELAARLVTYAFPGNKAREQAWKAAEAARDSAVKLNAPFIVASAIRMREIATTPEFKGRLTTRILERTRRLREDLPYDWKTVSCPVCRARDPHAKGCGAALRTCDICGCVNGDANNKFMNPCGREYQLWLYRDKKGEVHEGASADGEEDNVASEVLFAFHPCLPCAVACLAHVMTVFPASTFGFSGDPHEECGVAVLDHAYKLARGGVLDKDLMTRRDWVSQGLPASLPFPRPVSPPPKMNR